MKYYGIDGLFHPKYILIILTRAGTQIESSYTNKGIHERVKCHVSEADHFLLTDDVDCYEINFKGD